jgi:hypothetical protein
MATVCSVTLPVRAQAAARRVSVRRSSVSARTSAFVGQNTVRRAAVQASAPSLSLSASSRGAARGFTVVANAAPAAAPAAGDAIPPPAVFNVSRVWARVRLHWCCFSFRWTGWMKQVFSPLTRKTPAPQIRLSFIAGCVRGVGEEGGASPQHHADPRLLRGRPHRLRRAAHVVRGRRLPRAGRLQPRWGCRRLSLPGGSRLLEPHRLPSTGCVLVGTPGCQAGHVDHARYWVSSIGCVLTHNNNVSEECQPYTRVCATS